MPQQPTDRPDGTRDKALEKQWERSASGFVTNGEEIFVPWGTTDDWDLILSVYHTGTNEIGSQKDNALMEFTLRERELANKSGWEVETSSAFRFWNEDRYRDLAVRVKYLMVAK